MMIERRTSRKTNPVVVTNWRNESIRLISVVYVSVNIVIGVPVGSVVPPSQLRVSTALHKKQNKREQTENEQKTKKRNSIEDLASFRS